MHENNLCFSLDYKIVYLYFHLYKNLFILNSASDSIIRKTTLEAENDVKCFHNRVPCCFMFVKDTITNLYKSLVGARESKPVFYLNICIILTFLHQVGDHKKHLSSDQIQRFKIWTDKWLKNSDFPYYRN